METVGLVHDQFDTSVYTYTLAFRDPELESAYQSAKEHFEFLSPSCKRFLYVVLIGFFIVQTDDAISAVGLNPNYTLTFFDWVSYLWMVPAFLLEALCYFYKPLSVLRGAPVTLLGCVTFFLASFIDHAGGGSYPYLNTQYDSWCLTPTAIEFSCGTL